MLLSNQALWPIENSAVTRIRTMAHKLNISIFKESTTSTDVRTFFLVCCDIFKEKWGNRFRAVAAAPQTPQLGGPHCQKGPQLR